jgi:Trypsin-co-occurring domain 1
LVTGLGRDALVERSTVTQQRLVSAGGAQFYVEVADVGGPATIRDDGAPLSFDGVRATVEGIATELAGVWQRVKPAEASVEFGLKLTAKSGKLTGLVIEGGGEAALTVTLTWKQPGAKPAAEVRSVPGTD